MNRRDKKQWYRSFSDNPAFTDDGISHDFTEWCEVELFGASLSYLISIVRVEDAGLTIYGKPHSDKWEISRPISDSTWGAERSRSWPWARPTIESPAAGTTSKIDRRSDAVSRPRAVNASAPELAERPGTSGRMSLSSMFK